MKKLLYLIDKEPLRINIDKKSFFKFFLIGLIFINYIDFIKLIFIDEKNFSAPVFLLQALLKPWFVTLVGITFFISSITLLFQDIPARIFRIISFLSFAFLVGAQGSYGLINHAQDSILSIFLFLSLLPNKAFSSTEGDKEFNQAVLYGGKLIMLFYTISGTHKLYYFFACMFTTGCLAATPFFDHHIFSNAFLRNLHIPMGPLFENMTSVQGNVIFFIIAMVEFLAFFATFSRKSYRLALEFFILMHIGTMIFMRIHFIQFIYTHLLLLVFFLVSHKRRKAID